MARPLGTPGHLQLGQPLQRLEPCGHTCGIASPFVVHERAVAMVLEIRARDGKGRGELARVGWLLGVHPAAPRTWVGGNWWRDAGRYYD